MHTYSYIWPNLGSCSILARFATGFAHIAHDLVTKMGVHHVQPIAVFFSFGGGWSNGECWQLILAVPSLLVIHNCWLSLAILSESGTLPGVANHQEQSNCNYSSVDIFPETWLLVVTTLQ